MDAKQKIKECIKNKACELDLNSMNLSCLPELPNFIKILKCANNQITQLPEKLPNSLQKIFCNNNQITKLTGKLPDSLQIIYCYNNQITKLRLRWTKHPQQGCWSYQKSYQIHYKKFIVLIIK